MKFTNKLIARLTLVALFLANCSVMPEQAGLSNSSANERNITAFTHVNLVPMTAEIVLENQTVLIEGSRIIAIGPTDEVSIPPDAVIIDGEGGYLMPGLADMHMHTNQDWDTDYRRMARIAPRPLPCQWRDHNPRFRSQWERFDVRT